MPIATPTTPSTAVTHTESLAGIVAVARSEAVFASDLPRLIPEPGDLSAAEITAAVRETVRRVGGVCGCAAHVAAECGEHPETAVWRMRWAVESVRDAFATWSAPLP